MELSNTFVILLGLGTVFVGLTCIIVICEIMGRLCNLPVKKKVSPEVNDMNTSKQEPSVEHSKEMVAAISAVIAEELGTDVEAFRIHSIKKL